MEDTKVASRGKRKAAFSTIHEASSSISEGNVNSVMDPTMQAKASLSDKLHSSSLDILKPGSSRDERVSSAALNDADILADAEMFSALDTRDDNNLEGKGEQGGDGGDGGGGEGRDEGEEEGEEAMYDRLDEISRLRTLSRASTAGSRGTSMQQMSERIVGTPQQPGSMTLEEYMKLRDNVSTPAEQVYEDRMKTIPVVPGRSQMARLRLAPVKQDDVPTWYVVLSPRETKGVAGPFSINALRKMYQFSEIGDNNLVWTEGLRTWQQLCYLHALRTRLQQVPAVPQRLGNVGEDGVFNPIPEVPSVAVAHSIKPFEDVPLTKTCDRCGAHAVGFSTSHGAQLPDMVGLNKEVGAFTKLASEILPGFLWIGDKVSVKRTSIAELRTTLIINCTKNLPGPQPRRGFFRCKTIALKEKPKGNTPVDLEGLFRMLDEAHDWIENERILPDNSALQDMPEPYYRGKTDKYGRKIDKELAPWPIVRGQQDPPRVLVWSKDGRDRPVLVVAAYLIKHYGISMELALDTIFKKRPGCSLSKAYEYALREWSKRYTIGEMLCVDCIDAAIDDAKSNLQKMDQLNDGAGLIYTALSDEMKASGNAALQALGDPSTYLRKVFTGPVKKSTTTQPSKSNNANSINNNANSNSGAVSASVPPAVTAKWAGGLMDLLLNGRRLGDEGVATLFHALSVTGAAGHLRFIELRDNDIKQAGVFAIATALRGAEGEGGDSHSSTTAGGEGELLLLDLSHNRIGIDGDEGVLALCAYLSRQNSITCLDVSNNSISDAAGKAVFEAFTIPQADFAIDDMDDEGNPVTINTADMATLPYNETLTDLRVEQNNFGDLSAMGLANLMRGNNVLTHLRIDYNKGMPTKRFKLIFDYMRQFNFTLSHLSMSDLDMTIKVTTHFSKVLGQSSCNIQRLELQRCGLTSLHVAPFANKNARNLTHLDISGNPIGDTGAEWIAEFIRGKRDSNGELYHGPPIKKLDLNCCGLEYQGCKLIIAAAAERPSLVYLDLSDNKFYWDWAPTASGTYPIAGEFSSITDGNPFGFGGGSFVGSEGGGDVIDNRRGSVNVGGNNGNVSPQPSINGPMAGHNTQNGLSPNPQRSPPPPTSTATVLQSPVHYKKGWLMTNATLRSVTRVAGQSVASSSIDIDPDAIAQASIIDPELVQLFKKCCFHTLHLNRCQLHSSGASQLFCLLRDTSPGTLGSHLSTLSVAGNDIHDAATDSLMVMLRANMKIECLDLGFNSFTDRSTFRFKDIVSVPSDATPSRKLLGLNINFMGNNVKNTLVLETPAMGRSKSTFNFGTLGRPDHEDLEGSSRSDYRHIPKLSRDHFALKKEAHDTYTLLFSPKKAINSIQ